MTFNKLILASAFFFTSMTVNADVLMIDVISKEPANSTAGILRPKKGQSMASVTATFGEPTKTYPTIGKPPITRWNYSKFSVYFEHNFVIHSVINKAKSTP